MKNKFLCSLLALLFSISANASSQSTLKAIFDAFNYSVQVEWDQQDQNFYNAQVSRFSHALNDVMKKGLTKEQLVAFLKTEVSDPQLARDIEAAFNLISIQRMSASEAADYLSDIMKG